MNQVKKKNESSKLRKPNKSLGDKIKQKYKPTPLSNYRNPQTKVCLKNYQKGGAPGWLRWLGVRRLISAQELRS